MEYPQEPLCGYCHEKIAAHPCPGKVGKLRAELEQSNRLNGELLKTLGSAIQYLDHSQIGHNRDEVSPEIRHDETCFKCKALRVYFDAEGKQTEKRKDEQEFQECPKCHVKVPIGGGLWLAHVERHG